MRFLFLFLAIATSALAETSFDGKLTVDYVSAYVFRGVKVDDESFQPALELEYGSVYASLWANRPAKGEGSEIDLSAGATFLNFDVGINAYTYPGRDKTTWEPYIGYAYETGDFEFSVTAFRDLTLRTTCFEGKVVAPLITYRRFDLSAEAALGNAHGRDLPSYTYWSAAPVLRYKAGKSLLASISVVYSSVSASDLDRDLWVTRTGVTWTF